MASREYVEVEVARAASGVRLVVLGGVPSPWSIAAKALLDIQDIPALIVRKPRDSSVQAWTGVANAPVLIHDNDPPRSGWAEILALCESLRPDASLVPKDPAQRARLFGLSHELLGEGGLMWHARRLIVEMSLESEGKRGFSVPMAQYLAARYGHTPGCRAQAREQVRERFALFAEQLGERSYFFEDRLTALDIYMAAVLTPLALPPHEQCPVLPVARTAFEALSAELADVIPKRLLAQRALVHRDHLPFPLSL